MAVDWGRREGTSEYFDQIVNVAWVLAQSDAWMNEEEILSNWPESVDRPHVMMLDDIERALAYTKIAETDPELGWSKYRWPKTPTDVANAASDFRFSESYSNEKHCIGLYREVVLSDLFVPFPQQFGLRGDSFLWGKLCGYYRAWSIDADSSIEDTVKDGFREITGEDFDRARDEFYNDGLAHGGMSSGHVSMDWWRRTGLPLLVNRFEVIKPALPIEFQEPNHDLDPEKPSS